MAADEASFNTSMEAISVVFNSERLPLYGTPSRIIKGVFLPWLKEFLPLIRILVTIQSPRIRIFPTFSIF